MNLNSDPNPNSTIRADGVEAIQSRLAIHMPDIISMDMERKLVQVATTQRLY
jgi:hypothetical protein